MTLDSIFASIQITSPISLSDAKDESISLFDREPFYMAPNFICVNKNNNSRFIIFSAPGAAGKSALSRYIAYKYNALHWDLSKIRLGGNSFMGTLYKSLNSNCFSTFLESLKNGKAIMIIDAFDEAVMCSGKSNVDSLLKDIADYSEGANSSTFVLLARTETAEQIIDYYSRNNLQCDHYEIDFIPEANAKSFILSNCISNKNDLANKESTLKQCIEKQFSSIQRLLGNDADSFLGYPPVLEALSTSLIQNQNTFVLGKQMESGDMANAIINTILGDLLEREREDKVVNALKQRWASKYPNFDNWEILYSKSEQIVRILEYILTEDVGTFYQINGLEADIEQDYLNCIREFLPMHPFIHQKANEPPSFTGPAFRDYTLANLVSNSELQMLVDEYCNMQKTSFVPSEILINCYDNKNELPAKYFGLFYISAKAKERFGLRIITSVISDENTAELDFLLINGENSQTGQYSLKMCIDDPISIGNIKDADISYCGDISLGEGTASAEINNSIIECNNLIVQAKEVIFSAASNKICSIECEGDIVSDVNPVFKCFEEYGGALTVSAKNSHKYYVLNNYLGQKNTHDNAGLFEFVKCVDKILYCMRKHGKDAPAKDKEYVDFIIISQSDYKKKVRDFLISEGIIYTDTKDPHEYKLHIEKLSNYGVGWKTLHQFGVSKFNELYTRFLQYRTE